MYDQCEGLEKSTGVSFVMSNIVFGAVPAQAQHATFSPDTPKTAKGSTVNAAFENDNVNGFCTGQSDLSFDPNTDQGVITATDVQKTTRTGLMQYDR